MSDAGEIDRDAPGTEWRAFDAWQVRPGPRVTTRTVGGTLVLLDAGTGRYFSLDAIGTHAWAALVSSASVGEALRVLLAEYQVEPARLRGDLETLLSHLDAQGLVEVTRVS